MNIFKKIKLKLIRRRISRYMGEFCVIKFNGLEFITKLTEVINYGEGEIAVVLRMRCKKEASHDNMVSYSLHLNTMVCYHENISKLRKATSFEKIVYFRLKRKYQTRKRFPQMKYNPTTLQNPPKP